MLRQQQQWRRFVHASVLAAAVGAKTGGLPPGETQGFQTLSTAVLGIFQVLPLRIANKCVCRQCAGAMIDGHSGLEVHRLAL